MSAPPPLFPRTTGNFAINLKLFESCYDHMETYGAPNGSKQFFVKGDTSFEIDILLVDSKILL